MCKVSCSFWRILMREAELREAARVVGAGEVQVLPYEDQKLWTAPPDGIRRQIVNAIRAGRQS